MNKSIFVLVTVPLLLIACGRYPVPSAVTTAASTGQAAKFAGQPLSAERGKLFSGSGVCVTCHTAMTDTAGADVSIDSAWRATMMGNAARDPYHLASVRGEIASNPNLQTVIEDTCSKCHMPMARYSAMVEGGKGTYFGDGFQNPKNPLNALAMDGVSCTLCHQISAANLGKHESYDGGYAVDKETPAGKRAIFGPFAVTDANVALMQASSGFVPQESAHIKSAELCATCHTLYTPFVDAQGKVVGEFPEQMPYIEWLNSSYAKKQLCQDCHMPQAQGGVKLSITGGDPRAPFFQHTFVGGNTYILEIFKTFGEELGVTASRDQYAAKQAHMNEYYQHRTATLAFGETRLSGSRLTADVIVKSLAGHKLPSGFPSRRVWLHLSVRDANGNVIFESGAVKNDGAIIGNDNDADAARFEPHYAEITNGEQAQIYEAIMRDTDGKLTTTLLRAAAYSKDNRLLPVGFDKSKATEDIAVRGDAAQDKDFMGGGDTVRYAVDVGNAKGPFRVTAELLYQSISYRWAQNLRRFDAPEVARFLRYYASVPNTPAVVARGERVISNQ